MEWSNDVVLEFLSIYEGEPAIWNPRDPNHANRNLVHDAWKRIEGQMSVKFSVAELKKKDGLMASFRKLLQKVKASSRTGSGAQDVFKPNWFAYQFMFRFLHGIYMPNKTTDSEDSQQEENDDSESRLEENKRTEDGETVASSDEIQNCQEPSAGPSGIQQQTKRSAFEPPKGSVKGKKRHHADIPADCAKRMDEAYQMLKIFSEVGSSDECSLYCELLATKLRALDEITRETAMLQIDQLMFSIKHQPISGHVYPMQSYPFQHSSANPTLTYSYYQPPPNSHSIPNASFTPSPLPSSVSPHYQPSTISSDSELSRQSTPIQYEESPIYSSANDEDKNKNDDGLTLEKLFNL